MPPRRADKVQRGFLSRPSGDRRLSRFARDMDQMKILSKTVSIFALSVTLAACGGGTSESDDPAGLPAEDVPAPAGALVEDEPVAEEAAAAPDAAEADAPEDEPAPAPTPTATPTPEAAAAAAPVAAAAPPPIFAVCAACHAVEPGKHGIGPSLAGVLGAEAGHAAGFEYSGAMLASGLTWDEATLDRYLANPRQVVPGTTMAYNGLRNDAQRKAVVDYLKGL